MKIKNSPSLLKILHTPDAQLESNVNSMTTIGGGIIILGIIFSLILGVKFFLGLFLGFIAAAFLLTAMVNAMGIVGKGYKNSVKNKYVYVRSKGKGKFRGY